MKDPPESNKHRSFKALILPSKTFKLDIAQYTQKDLDQIIQSILQTQISKKRLAENKLKAKSLNHLLVKIKDSINQK